MRSTPIGRAGSTAPGRTGIRPITIAPAALSNSYLIGSERSGTSMITLISCGGLGPSPILLMSMAGLRRRARPYSGPGDQGRQRHQDCFGVACGLEPELGTAVV